jgi:hypothetical protein
MSESIRIIGAFIAGVVASFILESYLKAFWDWIKLYWKKRSIRKISLAFQYSEEVFALETGDPYLTKGDIKIIESGKKLFVDFPNDLRTAINAEGEPFVFNSQQSFDGSTSFKDLEIMTGITDLSDRIAKHARIVAHEFIETRKGYGTIFNGEKFGIFSIGGRNRVGKDEKTRIILKTFHTDFFTYRVFSSIYQSLKKEGHKISKVSSLEDLAPYSPFLTSFGVCTFVLLNDDTDIVLALRSGKITSKQHKYHFTMNEGLSQTDCQNGAPDIHNCLIRGMWEELNISYDEAVSGSVKLMDLFFTRDRFEIGITSVISFPDVSFEDFQFKREAAKDSFEIERLKCIKLEKPIIKEFLAKNEMIPDAKLGLQLFLARYF